MRTPNCCVMRTAGTNCDRETAFAFSRAGARASVVHINRFLKGQVRLADYQILALPGGFSYGDDVASGKLFANELRYKLLDEVKRFISEGKLVIGICNGFQILVKAGILPGNDEWRQEASLIINDSGKFEDRWVYLKTNSTGVHRYTGTQEDGHRAEHGVKQAISTRGMACLKNTSVQVYKHAGTQMKCVWTRGLPEIIELPVAHGEGKFVVKDNSVMRRLKRNGQIVFWYCDERGHEAGYPSNPNGSLEHVAGICDETGRVFGLMPHPERHMTVSQHPRWEGRLGGGAGDGRLIFKNGIEYVRKHL